MWNKYLAKFVNSLCKHLNKRSAKEAAQQTHGAGGTTANGTTANGTSSNGTNPIQASGFTPSQASGSASKRGRQQLSTQTQRRLAEVIVRMADKAQYSKVRGEHFMCQQIGLYKIAFCVVHDRQSTP